MSFDALIPQMIILGEVALAMLLGGIVGAEREMADKPAGFRTHVLVAGAAALLVGLADVMLDRFGTRMDSQILNTDPIRIIEAVITGISFLGAGTIFRSEKGQHVEGLTTAGSILLVASIGVCVALRQFPLAIGVTLLALVVLRGLRRVEKWIGGRSG